MKRSFTVRPNSVAVLGFHDGSAGQVETWFEDVTGYHIACFVHEAAEPLEVDVQAENRKRVSQRTEFPTRDTFKGRPFIVSMDWIEEIEKIGIRKVLPLTPNNREQLRQIKICRANGIELVSAIHPTVTILPEARIEPGVWINANSLIGYKAEIESGVIINTGVQIDHHNVLECCCQVDPGVVTAGNVTLRECSQVCTGAMIINPRCTAVGVPARVIKHHGS